MLGLFNRKRRFRKASLLTKASGLSGDNLGGCVAISDDGNTVILGAPNADVSGRTDEGYVTVFIRSGTGWTEQQTINSFSGLGNLERFGSSVGLSSDGNTAIVGCWHDTIAGKSEQGSAGIFTRSGSTWTLQQKITKSDGTDYDNFGHSVAISNNGNTAIVGAPYDSFSAGAQEGSATVFTRSGTTWTEQQILSKSGRAANDNFGWSVALSSDGNTAIVGAYQDDVGANTGQGTATVFTRSGSTWSEQQILTQTGGAANDNFGYSVALSDDGNTAIVGAYLDNVGANTDQGSATIFTRSGSTWSEQQTINKSDGAVSDYFGASVALSGDGNTAIVGAYLDDIGANSNQGSATIFTRVGSVWTEKQIIIIPDGEANDQFGYSVSLSSSGNTAVVSARADDVGVNANQGSATTFYRR